MKIEYPFNYEIVQRFYVRGWCKYCGTGCDEVDFKTLEEVAKYLASDPFLCLDCEIELEKEGENKK